MVNLRLSQKGKNCLEEENKTENKHVIKKKKLVINTGGWLRKGTTTQLTSSLKFQAT
jgi:hypothetical protein